jgi:hypothetical protein
MEKISNKYRWLVAALLIAITVGVLSFLVMNQRKAGLSTIQSSIQNMGHLVALKVNVKDVEQIVIHGPLGPKTVILVFTGNCTIASDLREIIYKSVDKNNRTVTLVLPAPTILQAQVNHTNNQCCPVSFLHSVSFFSVA